jgi:hypothetical protein
MDVGIGISGAQDRVAHHMRRAHGLLESTMDDIDLDDLRRSIPGSLANTIIGTYFHIASGYERLVHREVRKITTVYDRAGWSKRLPVVDVNSPPGDPWFDTVTSDDVATIREYVGSVLGEAVAWVEAMSADEFNGRIDAGKYGSASVGELLIWPMLFHTDHHMGEISALLGTFGKQGMPF